MPMFSIFPIFLFLSVLISWILIPIESVIADHTAISTYYIRYDIKSSNHQIIADNILMVPAKNEFRIEKFSYISIPCVISMTQGESKNQIHQRAQKAALKKILENRGLKSVKSKNMVTIISYEGIVISPIHIINTQDNDLNRFSYTAQFQFSPIIFPDKWKELKTKATIKEKINDLFLLFQ